MCYKDHRQSQHGSQAHQSHPQCSCYGKDSSGPCVHPFSLTSHHTGWWKEACVHVRELCLWELRSIVLLTSWARWARFLFHYQTCTENFPLWTREHKYMKGCIWPNTLNFSFTFYVSCTISPVSSGIFSFVVFMEMQQLLYMCHVQNWLRMQK